jgi:cell division protein FtsQ
MLPRARARRARTLGWPFGRRGNRRVRASAGQPAVPPPPREPFLPSLLALLGRARRVFLGLGVGLALAAGAYGGRYYVTHARHFAVRDVRVSPLKHIAPQLLLDKAAVPIGINLFSIDRDEVARVIAQEPWVARVHVRRELPSTVVLDVTEREPACAVALGALYLAEPDGSVFKRATADEAAVMPVVTGVAREDYLAQPAEAKADIRQALAVLAAWHEDPARPPVGEVHVDRIAGVTLYTAAGVGVRLGVVDDSLRARLHRYDAVAQALPAGEEPRLIYVDNRARPDRVTVKLASAALATAHSQHQQGSKP